MSRKHSNKRKFSGLRLEDSLQLVQVEKFLPWEIDAPPRPPSAFLEEDLRRLRSFDLQMSEPAKALVVDSLLREIVPGYPNLKVWKAAMLETDTLTGVADYLITPDRDYIATPLLCAAEAKRDDFVQGRAQCVAEMYACRWQNTRHEHLIDVYGIVSNGQVWQFHRLTLAGELCETGPYTIRALPELLGALDHICARCAKNAS